MIAVTARLAAGRAIAVDSFTDLTSVPVVSVVFDPDGRLRVTFASDIDAPTARRVRRRILSSDLAEENLRQDIFVTAVVISQWESPMPSPTLLKVLDRVEILSRQVRQLTRLTLMTDDEPPGTP